MADDGRPDPDPADDDDDPTKKSDLTASDGKHGRRPDGQGQTWKLEAGKASCRYDSLTTVTGSDPDPDDDPGDDDDLV